MKITNNTRTLSWLIRAVAACCLAGISIGHSNRAIGQSAPAVIAITADRLFTMDGPVIEGGIIIVRDGKIAEVGKDLEIPAAASRHHVPVLIPGLVDSFSSAGLAGGGSEATSEVTPEFNVLNAVDWDSVDFERALDDGITTVHILPGSENVFAGGSCVAKVPVDSRTRILSERYGSVVSICSDPAGGNNSRTRPDSIYVRQPTNRMGVVWIIRSQLHKTVVSGAESPPERASPKSLALRKMSEGEPVFAISRASYDIETAARLGAEFGFKPTIVSAEEGWKAIEVLVEAKMPVIYSGTTTGSDDGSERTELRWNTPAQLNSAGIVWALGGGRLLDQARFAVRYGVSDQAALEAITSTPAALVGQADRVGKIRVGMDADLVALDGPPLEFSTALIWTMVEGVTSGGVENLSTVALLDTGATNATKQTDGQ